MCELRYFAFKKEQRKKEQQKQCHRCGVCFEEGDEDFCQSCCDYFQNESEKEMDDWFQRCCDEDKR